MERLTRKFVQKINGRNEIEVVLPAERTVQEAVNRLAELEDKIESGTLVELPCKIGVPVYSIEMDFNDWETEWYIIKIGFSIGFLNDWGKYVFATREEAEKRLEELKK